MVDFQLDRINRGVRATRDHASVSFPHLFYSTAGACNMGGIINLCHVARYTDERVRIKEAEADVVLF